jgi:uncharacterized membrane protein (UPF0127 family)
MQRGAMRANGKLLLPQAWRTESAAERMRGLLGRDGLPEGCGLLIDHCGAIHTLGMRFALDVVFLDAGWRVVRVVAGVRPGRWFVWGGWRARRVLEVASGWLNASGLRGARLVYGASDPPNGPCRRTSLTR